MAFANRTSQGRSRPSTPASLQLNGNVPTQNENVQQELGNLPPTRWVEPPLATPVPSWMEYKGLEKTNVVSGMMPLGTMPPSKLRVKPKADPLRRTAATRNLGNGLARPESHTRSTSRSPSMNPAIDPALQDQNQNYFSDIALPQDQGVHSAVDQVPAPPPSFPQPPPVRMQTPTTQTPMSATPVDHTPNANESPSKNMSPFVNAMQQIEARGGSGSDRALKTIRVYAEHDQEFASLLAAVSGRSPSIAETHAYRTKLTALKRAVRSSNGTPHGHRLASDSTSPTVGKENAHHLATKSPQIKINNTPTSHLPDVTPSTSTPSNLNVRSTRSNPTKSVPIEQPEHLIPTKKGSRHGSSSSLSSVDEAVVDGPSPSPSAYVKCPSSLTEYFLMHSYFSMNTRGGRQETDMPEGDKSALADMRHRYNQGLQPPVVAAESFERPVLGSSRKRRASVLDTQPEGLQPAIKLRVKQHNALRTGLADGTLRSSTSHLPDDADPSRGPTPTALGRPPKRLKQQAAARVKISPMKKRTTGLVAGISSGRHEAPVEEDGPESPGDAVHGDVCHACGRPGLLLCCDGCYRAFHMSCVDPPMEQDAVLDEAWYCYICEARRHSRTKLERGMFTELLDGLVKKNPSDFLLPQGVRDFFEGVGTAEYGVYEDSSNAKPINNRRGFFIEPVDTTKQRDRNGNIITCHACGQTSWNRREILHCDYCRAYWHLDCLAPPAPHRPVGAGQKWMCPNHTDHDLKRIDPIRNTKAHEGAVGFHRIRKPRHSKVIKTDLRRRIPNNGNIEIESEAETETDSEPDTDDYYGSTLSLPAKGVKLDFISKIKADRQESNERSLLEQSRLSLATARLESRSSLLEFENQKRLSQALERLPLEERQGALNLTQFRFPGRDLNLGNDMLRNLLHQAEAEAPAGVIESIVEKDRASKAGLTNGEQTALPPLLSEERQALLELQKWIASRLQTSAAS
ncbi:MAG: hypothetical protein M1828_003478 [Chrysothrix sp. TS-e1954]|nr:MAG: hypothetical protein M1828_003478 [Chrysothrix sp. TS-e1954]